MNTEEIKTELKQKERYISDLLRFIGTRTDNNPNYSLLLGSGCSVTSNIRSGGELINGWRQEIYEDLTQYDEDSLEDKEYSSDRAIDYLTKNCGAWYNKSNEYSSLFEKKYDLPRQRRMFVEKEVSDKTPSIGYAYLINLIKDSYFNTLFTTNFDDLINEAFYQFSDDRPMTCAHDSSALENNPQEVYKNLTIALDKNALSKYEFEDWPVFWELKEEPKFKALFTKEFNKA